jgi:hypothetical protein
MSFVCLFVCSLIRGVDIRTTTFFFFILFYFIPTKEFGCCLFLGWGGEFSLLMNGAKVFEFDKYPTENK